MEVIVNTVKQTYGGNIDMAIRYKDVVDKTQLYALATGQTPKGMPRSAAADRPVTLAERGGAL